MMLKELNKLIKKNKKYKLKRNSRRMKLKAFTLNSWKKNHARSDTWNYPLNK